MGPAAVEGEVKMEEIVVWVATVESSELSKLMSGP
jgi:hypothetical protein